MNSKKIEDILELTFIIVIGSLIANLFYPAILIWGVIVIIEFALSSKTDISQVKSWKYTLGIFQSVLSFLITNTVKIIKKIKNEINK